MAKITHEKTTIHNRNTLILILRLAISFDVQNSINNVHV